MAPRMCVGITQSSNASGDAVYELDKDCGRVNQPCVPFCFAAGALVLFPPSRSTITGVIMQHLPLTAISVLSALGLAVGTAVAQQTPGALDPAQQAGKPSTQELLSEYDQDANQTLSQEEFSRLYQERMQASSSQGGQQAQPGQQPQAQPP